MKITRLALMLMAGVALASCQSELEEVSGGNSPSEAPRFSKIVPVSESGKTACCTYWTEDAKGQPVLCWSETEQGKEEYVLCFAPYDSENDSFGATMEVSPSLGQKAHGESMAKVGFRADGSAVAVYRRSTPTPENRFAGSIYTSTSDDYGTTWSDETKLVQDPSSQSQSFFDLCRLGTGELGMIWLDGRKVEPDSDGSTLFFATTNSEGVFANEKPIDGGTCQCCRTDLYRDTDGLLHVAFRDILNDSIRDMVHFVSSDEGQSFSKPALISPDNWVIAGCPHTGPSLAKNASGLGCSWYTQGGKRGVYFGLKEKEGPFGSREMVSAEGAHPQLVNFGEDKFAILLEEFVDKDSTTFNQVKVYQRDGKGEFKQYEVSEPGQNGKFATVKLLSEKSFATAWTDGEDSLMRVAFRRVDF